MRSYYQNINPFNGEIQTELYQDSSNTFIPNVFYTEILFDGAVDEQNFIKGSYKILTLDNNKTIGAVPDKLKQLLFN